MYCYSKSLQSRGSHCFPFPYSFSSPFPVPSVHYSNISPELSDADVDLCRKWKDVSRIPYHPSSGGGKNSALFIRDFFPFLERFFFTLTRFGLLPLKTSAILPEVERWMDFFTGETLKFACLSNFASSSLEALTHLKRFLTLKGHSNLL